MTSHRRTNHLSDFVEMFIVKLERLLEQDFVLHRPLVRERSEIGQVRFGDVDIELVPAEHSQRLFHIVAVLFLRYVYEILHYT